MDLRTGCPYWTIRNGLLASYPRLTSDDRADVAVIGAGITGAALAYSLARAGFSVIVLDRREVASGSTAASTGLLLYEIDTSLADLAEVVGLEAAVRAYAIGREAIDGIEETCDQVGDTCGFARRPCLYLATSARDLRELERERDLRKSRGFDVALLGSDELRRRFCVDAPGALMSPGQGEIDTVRFSHRLLAAAVALGARVYDRTDVTRVRRRHGRLTLTTRDALVQAKRVVWAGGYETTEWLGRRITDLNSTWACATEPLEMPEWEQPCVLWETARPYFYMRTTDDGRLLVGGEDSRYSRRHESPSVLGPKSAALLSRVHHTVERVVAEPAYSWGGVFAETRDGLPFVGPIDDPDVWYTLGYGGNGITFGVFAAALVTDAFTGTPNRDLALFAFDRSTHVA